MSDPFDLQRFVTAQDPVIDRAMAELRAGRKTSHWMWFVFPQLAGLGHSDMARRFAISGREEADAYLRHPVLGSRLRACTKLVNVVAGRTAHEIFGSPDDLKFRSSMTLFAAVAPDDAEFAAALHKYFDGVPDPATLRAASFARPSPVARRISCPRA
jgi:uncharacterized protein (DUF1810 family)